MTLVDSHCHLDFPAFAEDLDAVIGRARDAGVGAMVTICTHLSRFDQVRAIAEAYDDVTCTVGVHPHEAGPEGQRDPERLIELARHDKVVGIGETGLDYHYEHSPRAQQQVSFRAHIGAARATGLPVVVHTREAEADTLSILREEWERGPFTGVLHRFSSSRALAEAAIELGLYVSFSGIVTFQAADELRETAAVLPLDRILVETDAPYLAPVPRRGKRNEPAYVVHTAALLAERIGVDAEAFARATTDNFHRLFTRAPRAAGAAA